MLGFRPDHLPPRKGAVTGHATMLFSNRRDPTRLSLTSAIESHVPPCFKAATRGVTDQLQWTLAPEKNMALPTSAGDA